MTIYIDPLVNWGWVLRGREVESCHMFTDSVDLSELHHMALAIGMKRAWFQNKSTPHYDLVASRRIKAIELGAVELDRDQAVAIWRARRGAAVISAEGISSRQELPTEKGS